MGPSDERVQFLIADDYQSMQDVLTDVLNDLGYTKIHTVSTPEQFWSTLSTQTPDILLLDTVLSYKSVRPVYGYEICHTLRTHPLGQEMGIIGMSSEDYTKEWYDAGADYFFSKVELDPIVLEDSIDRLVKQYKTTQIKRF